MYFISDILNSILLKLTQGLSFVIIDTTRHDDVHIITVESSSMMSKC